MQGEYVLFKYLEKYSMDRIWWKIIFLHGWMADNIYTCLDKEGYHFIAACQNI